MTFNADVSTITEAQINAIQDDAAAAIDGTAGGSYTPTGDIDITDGAGGAFGDIDVHGQIHLNTVASRLTFKFGTLPTTDNQSIGIASGGQILLMDDSNLTGTRDHDMDNTGALLGDFVIIGQTNGMVDVVTIRRPGSGWAGAAIVTFTTVLHGFAMLYFDGTNWRLGPYSANVTAGADA